MPTEQNKFMPDRAEYQSGKEESLHMRIRNVNILYLFIRLTAIPLPQVAAAIKCG